MHGFTLYDRYAIDVLPADAPGPQTAEAFELEAAVVGGLWGDRRAVTAHISDTRAVSVLLLAYPLDGEGQRGPMLGAVRIVPGSSNLIPTMWEMAEDSGADLASVAELVANELATSAELVSDATSLAPRPGSVAEMAAATAVLLEACYCFGGSLLACGRTTHFAGHFHTMFLAFCRRQGYRLDPIGPPSGLPPFVQMRPGGAFTAVAGSLHRYHREIVNAPPSSPLARLRPTYEACLSVDLLAGLAPSPWRGGFTEARAAATTAPGPTAHRL